MTTHSPPFETPVSTTSCLSPSGYRYWSSLDDTNGIYTTAGLPRSGGDSSYYLQSHAHLIYLSPHYYEMGGFYVNLKTGLAGLVKNVSNIGPADGVTGVEDGPDVREAPLSRTY